MYVHFPYIYKRTYVSLTSDIPRIRLLKYQDCTDNVQAFQAHRTDSADDYYPFFQREDLEDAVAGRYNVTKRVTKKEKGESFDPP